MVFFCRKLNELLNMDMQVRFFCFCMTKSALK